MITLQALVQCQLVYGLLGMLFNFVSIFCIYQGAQQLTPNDPYMGCISMTIYLFFLIPGLQQKVKLYRILMVIAVILLGYGGVIQHISLYQNSPELYSSTTSAIIGPGINVYGLILNLIAMFGLYKTNK